MPRSLRKPRSGASHATALDSLKGCKCQPSYYVFQRDTDGKPSKSVSVKDRKTADMMLRAAQRDLDEGRGGVRRAPRVTFNEWADRYEDDLEGRVKPKTRDGYLLTLKRARDSFGNVYLDEIGNSELRRFDNTAAGDDSRLRYLRELGACLAAAVADKSVMLNDNPVPAFTKTRHLKKKKRGKAPFDRAELARLWLEFRKTDDPTYLYVARLSAETGLRLRELIGLDWNSVSLSERTIEVGGQWHERYGVQLPKDNEPRTVYLTWPALRVLEQWAARGVDDDGPVFPNSSGGRLSAQVVQHRFADAMTKAGIPKLHPKLKLPRTFHSLRYTTSVLMQQRGCHPRLIEQNLGHSSLELTYGVYGGWTPDMLREAARNPG